MAKKSEGTDKTDGKQHCQYKYRHTDFNGKSCPYEALPDKDLCYWHEKRDGKNIIEEKGNELKNYDLAGAYLHESNLQGANLEGAILVDSILSKSKLKGANLSKANLSRANLKEAQLQGANLHYQYLELSL